MELQPPPPTHTHSYFTFFFNLTLLFTGLSWILDFLAQETRAERGWGGSSADRPVLLLFFLIPKISFLLKSHPKRNTHCALIRQRTGLAWICSVIHAVISFNLINVMNPACITVSREVVNRNATKIKGKSSLKSKLLENKAKQMKKKKADW